MLITIGYCLIIAISIYISLVLSWKVYTRRFKSFRTTPHFAWLGYIPYVFHFKDSDLYKNIIKIQFDFNHFAFIWMGPMPTFRLSCVEYLEPLLHGNEVITKSSLYNFVQDWLGVGLLTSTGSKWKKRRAALTPAFHFNILHDYLNTFETYSKRLVRIIRDSSEKTIEVQAFFSLVTLDVICEATMGVEINALQSSDLTYINALMEVKNLFGKRVKKPYLWSKLLYRLSSEGKQFYHNVNILQNFTIDVINKRIAKRKQLVAKDDETATLPLPSLKLKRAFLDTLLDIYERGDIDLEGIREEVDTFMFEGHDTTASALSFTIYELGRHHMIQEKLYVEIKHASKMDCSLKEKLQTVKYLENVIKEGLRLHPPVGTFGRLVEKDTVINNTWFPSGSELFINAHSLHLNPEYWEDPKTFNPDRFDSDLYQQRNPYSYLPFSAGPRNCIGQKFALLELKMFLFDIVLNFQVRSVQGPQEIEEHCIRMITESSNGIYVDFISR